MDDDSHDAKSGDAPDSASIKGKGEEKQDADGNDGPSVMSRLQNSARMAGGTFASARAGLPDPPTTSQDKGMPSSTSASASGSTHYQNAYQEAAGDAATRPVRKAEMGETFRQPQREIADTARNFDKFLHTHQKLPGVGQIQLAPDTLDSQAQRMAMDRSVAEVETTDGSVVAHLLSQPDDFDMMPAAEEQDETLSGEDAAKLRMALFSDASSGRLPWDHLLNFTPEFVSSQNPSRQGQMESEMQLGTTDQGSAADIWVRQWHDVLSAYTDEVWGDLGTLVAEAKREIEQDLLGEDSERPEAPALSRLKMILAHVRGVL